MKSVNGINRYKLPVKMKSQGSSNKHSFIVNTVAINLYGDRWLPDISW